MNTRFIHGTYLPANLLNTTPLHQLWASTLEHIFLVNDILSGYKEVQAGDISLLALLVARNGCLQATIDTAVEGVRVAAKHMDEAVAELKSMTGEDEEMIRRNLVSLLAVAWREKLYVTEQRIFIAPMSS